LDGMARSFPDADIQCLWNDAPSRFADRTVNETWLSTTALRRHKALALPFTAAAWRRVPATRQYDWMLISSHLFAHHAHIAGQDVPKFVYAHTPARYIWNPELDGRGYSTAVRAVAPLFQALDRKRAQEATAVACNSEFVRERIARAWEREAVVIHPPAPVDRILGRDDWRSAVTDEAERRILDELPETFILGASRFVAYKRLDLVIDTAERLGVPVVIAGHGPDADMLRSMAIDARIPARIVESPSDELLYALYQRAAVLVFPPVEDFGITPVEAQAAGTPVVVGPVGGQLETFTEGVSGVVAEATNAEAFADAVRAAWSLPRFDAQAVTERFAQEGFDERIRQFVRASTPLRVRG